MLYGLFGDDLVVMIITIGGAVVPTVVTLAAFLSRLWVYQHLLTDSQTPDKLELGLPEGDPRMN